MKDGLWLPALLLRRRQEAILEVSDTTQVAIAIIHINFPSPQPCSSTPDVQQHAIPQQRDPVYSACSTWVALLKHALILSSTLE